MSRSNNVRRTFAVPSHDMRVIFSADVPQKKQISFRLGTTRQITTYYPVAMPYKTILSRKWNKIISKVSNNSSHNHSTVFLCSTKCKGLIVWWGLQHALVEQHLLFAVTDAKISKHATFPTRSIWWFRRWSIAPKFLRTSVPFNNTFSQPSLRFLTPIEYTVIQHGVITGCVILI